MNWATVPAEEVMQQGVRVGTTLGPLSHEKYTGWFYRGYLVVLHHERARTHICAVFDRQGQPVWLDSITEAGLAILTAAGVR